MTVDDMVEHILETEGGFVNHKADRGGATKYGVTQGTLSLWLKRLASVDDVRNLTKETAEEVYKSTYYYGPRIDTLPEALQPQIFDMSINHGPRRAIVLLQDVLNVAGYTCSSDGVLGPTTRKLAEQAYTAMGSYLINAISERRELFYNAIVAGDPRQAAFINGWIKRARSYRTE